MFQTNSLQFNLERLAFGLTVLGAGLTFWIAPRPSLIDLPQHAAQIALWRNLAFGESAWREFVEINYFTPYLLGYGAGLILSFVMPVVVALKVLLSVAFYGFVGSCILLRKLFQGDSRLDWLFIISFFGFGYSQGMFTFLLSCPIGLLSIWIAGRFAEKQTVGLGVALALSSLSLFFCHGLIFLFANAVGVGLVLLKVPRSLHSFKFFVPYLFPGILCVAFVVFRLQADPSVSQDGVSRTVWWGAYIYRIKLLFFHPLGNGWQHLATTPLVSIYMSLPLFLGSRPNKRCSSAFVPFGVFIAFWLIAPSSAFDTAFLIERFQIFFLPFYALLFEAPQKADAPARRFRQLRAGIGVWLGALASIYWLAVQVSQERDFATESADFEEVLASAMPGQRALGLVLDSYSPAKKIFAYVNFPLWYQTERSGLVDFNFAHYLPQIVRFRQGTPKDVTGGAWKAREFDWQRYQAWQYRYFFVRTEEARPPSFFLDGPCKPEILRKSGNWLLYENVRCYSPTASSS